MKTLIAGAIAVVLAGSASADLTFGFGANMFKTNLSGAQAAAGQNFTVLWAAGEGIALGVYFERTDLEGGGYSSAWGADTLTTQSIQISKTVLKNVSVLGRIGAGTARLTPSGAPVTVTAPSFEVGGQVTIITATGEKVTGTLVGIIAARFCNPNPNPKVDGANVALAIQAEF